MIYLDTSAAVPLFVAEPASAAVDAWFEAFCGAGLCLLPVSRGAFRGRRTTRGG